MFCTIIRYIYLIVFILLCLPVFSQQEVLEEKINITAVDQKLGDVLLKISTIAKVDFSYNAEIVPVDSIITIIARNEKVSDILDKILDTKTLKYQVVGNQLVIYREKPVIAETHTEVVSENKIPHEKVITKEIIQDISVAETAEQTEEIQETAKDSVMNDKDADEEKLQGDTINTFSELSEDISKQTDTTQLKDTSYREFWPDTAEAVITLHDTTKTFSRWSADVYISPLYFSNKFGLVEGYEGMVNELNAGEKPIPGYSYGAGINYDLNRIRMSTGISFTQFRNKAYYNFPHENIDTITDYNITPDNYWDVFCVDSFYIAVGPDTTWEYIMDSTFITEYDTTETITYDTAKWNSIYDNLNSYTYFEIPVAIGYRFVKGRLSYMVRGGVIAGIFLKTKGQTLSAGAVTDYCDLNDLPFIKTKFSILLGISASYSVTSRLSVYVSPDLRIMTGSIYGSAGHISHRMSGVSVRVGLEWRIG